MLQLDGPLDQGNARLGVGLPLNRQAGEAEPGQPHRFESRLRLVEDVDGRLGDRGHAGVADLAKQVHERRP